MRELIGHAVSIEVCERRLVFSAQLLFDPLDGPLLEPHGGIASGPGFDVETHLAEAHAATGWNIVQEHFGLTGDGQTVAVIDSGIAWDHVALGKGFGPGYRVVGGWDFTEENDANPYDDGPAGFHGTHVAGIIGSDAPLHSGVAPEADLVALRVFNDLGQGQIAWVEKALQWVHEHRNSFENPITTVNLSLGTPWNADVIPEWATLEEELQTLANDGILVVASAGNSFKQYNEPGLSYPAASPFLLPVASVDDQGQLSEFSQRNERVLAAPGENIVSTIPDYVLGRDGHVDDYSRASGTSMSSPYVAGASVLVREAMEMVGYTSITTQSIIEHLHQTADSVFDAATGLSYDRLNLAFAIDSIIPDDTIADTLAGASRLDLATVSTLDGWINELGDQDVYRFTPTTDGVLDLDASSDWVESLHWSLQTGGQQLATSVAAGNAINLIGGQTYELVVGANNEIGSFNLGFHFQATSGGSGSNGSGSEQRMDLGTVAYSETTTPAGSQIAVRAAKDGVFTVQWSNDDHAIGAMQVTSGGVSQSDASWVQGELRVDLNVHAGDLVMIELPAGTGDTGTLAIANVIERIGGTLMVQGTLDQDVLSVDLQDGLRIDFGAIDYSFADGVIQDLQIDGAGNSDAISVVGSQQSDKVELTPRHSSIENRDLRIAIESVEDVSYHSGGGPDRVYLYDSETDDTLTARPRQAELKGVGYRFSVAEVDRIFVHANAGGENSAYLYDSIGDDSLSVRPQFTSMSGDGFFNYVRGFERVYVYANQGGTDEADLYDSAGNDRFTTSGVSAAITGPGFSSYTRFFEQVHAHADAGGVDLATLYGAGSETTWDQGTDFISYREQNWNREARGFEQVQTYLAGQAYSYRTQTLGELVHASSIDPVSIPQSWAQVTYWSESVGSTIGPAMQRESLDQQMELGPSVETNGNRLMLDSFAPLPLSPVAEFSDYDQIDGLESSRIWQMSQVELPEEELLKDPHQELNWLDELFGQHGEWL